MRTRCKACSNDADRINTRKRAALAKINARREAIGWSYWHHHIPLDRVSDDDAEVCRLEHSLERLLTMLAP